MFPIKISQFFRKKVDHEIGVLGHDGGPLCRIVLPLSGAESPWDSQERADHVGDHDHEAIAGNARIIRKYRDRLLFLPTTSCISHCRYCFRQDYMMERPVTRSSLESAVDSLVDYVNASPELREVILSGGDPLALPPTIFAWLVESILSRTSASVRIHTKALTFHPTLLVNDHVEGALSRERVRTVFHILHPYEFCEEVHDISSRLIDGGARVFNQFPIIAGINDHETVLEQLFLKLENARIRTISVFAPEPVPGSGNYRVPLARFYYLMDKVEHTIPTWANTARWVLDSHLRKWRRDQIVSWDTDRRIVRFSADGVGFEFVEPDTSLYAKPSLPTLLWQDESCSPTGIKF